MVGDEEVPSGVVVLGVTFVVSSSVVLGVEVGGIAE